jgi:hypothetical protein
MARDRGTTALAKGDYYPSGAPDQQGESGAVGEGPCDSAARIESRQDEHGSQWNDASEETCGHAFDARPIAKAQPDGHSQKHCRTTGARFAAYGLE